MLVRRRRRAGSPDYDAPQLDDEHDRQEHHIFVLINLHHGYGHHGADDHVRLDDHRGDVVTIDVHDAANNDTISAVYRALHDARPALFHGGEPDDDAAACSWCADLAARRAGAPGDGVTSC